MDEIVPYSAEFAKWQESIRVNEFKNRELEKFNAQQRQVELLASKMIELCRYPDFRASQIFERFNEIMQTFDAFDDISKRETLYYLMDFLNHFLSEGDE